MATQNSQSYLVISRHSPYGSHQARAAIDLALTAAAFEQEVTLVFMDAGVLQLLPDQDCAGSGVKNIGSMIPALSVFEVKRVCIHQPSASALNLSPADLMPQAEAIGDAELKALLAGASQVMVF